MGLKTLFSGFSAEARTKKQFDKMVGKLVSRNYQSEDRMWVIDTLGAADTPEATAALFRRYDMTSDKKREDVAEKEHLNEVLAAKGEAVVPFIRTHINKSQNITHPVRVLARVVPPETVVEELLRVLAAEQARLAAFKPEKKLRLIELLADYTDDPRLAGGLLLSLNDFNADVRFEVARLLGTIGDEDARGPLVDRFANPEEDSLRVRVAILESLCDTGWKVVDRKDDLEGLPEKYRIGPKGNLILAD